MIVSGQLKKAQLERLGADPTGSGLYQGRVWFNTSDATFKFYDGSGVKSYAALEDLVADLNTLSGVAAGATNLGTFTGSIISDNGTIKAGMQELETYSENVVTNNEAFHTKVGNSVTTLNVSASNPGSTSFTNTVYTNTGTINLVGCLEIINYVGGSVSIYLETSTAPSVGINTSAIGATAIYPIGATWTGLSAGTYTVRVTTTSLNATTLKVVSTVTGGLANI